MTYVDTLTAKAPVVSRAQAERTRKLAACGGDVACEQQAMESTQAAIDKQLDLDVCLADAFSGSERNICNFKYGGSLFPF